MASYDNEDKWPHNIGLFAKAAIITVVVVALPLLLLASWWPFKTTPQEDYEYWKSGGF